LGSHGFGGDTFASTRICLHGGYAFFILHKQEEICRIITILHPNFRKGRKIPAFHSKIPDIFGKDLKAEKFLL